MPFLNTLQLVIATISTSATSLPGRSSQCRRIFQIRLKFQVQALLLLSISLTSCGGSNQDNSLILTNDTARRQAVDPQPIGLAYVRRCTAAIADAIDRVEFCAGGDLFYRSSISASGDEINITGLETQGLGDVQGVGVSLDGNSLVFSMRRPQDKTFNIWLYNIDRGLISAVLINDDGNDIDPTFLPNGHIVFSSDRQQRSRLLMHSQGVEPYTFVDEYRRNPSTLLHTMKSDGADLQQITFNLSHDRFPSVRSDGKILFSRWSHLGNKSRYDLYTVNSNGTGLSIEYGAFSSGNSHLAPQEMSDGRLISTVAPLAGSHQGGAVMIIDSQHFDEQSKPNSRAFIGGDIRLGLQDQYQATARVISLGNAFSAAGRFAKPFPLKDGSPRFIASYTFLQAEDVTSPVTGSLVKRETDIKYQLVMVDMDDNTMQTLARLAGAYSIFGAVTIRSSDNQSRAGQDGATFTTPTPEQQLNKSNDLKLDIVPGETPTGILNVLSVYDTESGYMARMDESVLVASLGETIPTIAPSDPADKRERVADIGLLKDPKQSSATDRPARYFRVTKGVAMPAGISQQTVGETDYEMRQIVGYGDVQPDGSIRTRVPADTPITIEVLDKEGRAFAPHLSWLQVRPGETRTCHGCHSPRAELPLYSQSLRSSHSNSNFQPRLNESMAETLARETNGDSIELQESPSYEDVWTDPSSAERAPDSPERLDYTNVPVMPTGGIINYPDHVQPIWERERGLFGSDTCTSCHTADNNLSGVNSSAGLDLSSTLDAAGRHISYQSLLLGAPILKEQLPQIVETETGENLLLRKPALVAAGHSRSSVLTEILYHTEIKAEHHSLDDHFMNHQGLLSKGELRIINEWIDLGAQYYNTVFETDAADDVSQGYTFEQSEVRRHSLKQTPPLQAKNTFNETIHPILLTECGYCHRSQAADDSPIDITQIATLKLITQPESSGNRFILTGHSESDFSAVLTMIDDINSPNTSLFLLKPASVNNNPFTHPHKSVEIDPSTGLPLQSLAYLPVGSTNYELFLTWMSSFRCQTAQDCSHIASD